MQRASLLKVLIGLTLAIGLPLGSALAYMTWSDAKRQAVKDRYDAAHAIIYTIPAGASTQFKPIEEQALDLPEVITMTVGLSDTLRIENADGEIGRAGPFRIAGGSTYRQQFQAPGRFEFECDIDEKDSLTVVVLPAQP